jgi:hypothetical protein
MSELEALTMTTDWIRTNGALGAVVLFVAGILRGWWVTAREYSKLLDDVRAMEVDRDHWRRMSLATGSAAAAVIDGGAR